MIRLVQVGLGGWGRDWARTILRPAKEIELVGCVERDTIILDDVQVATGLPAEKCFTTLAAALAMVQADAILITTNLPAHVPTALEALEAGKHVLLEKPFAPSVAEAIQVVNKAAAVERVLMTSQNYRFFPAPQAVATLVREGVLGAVGTVNLDFRRYANRASPEGHRHYTITQPLLIDMSIHHFDLLRFVLGCEPQEIDCHSFNPTWSKFVEPAAAVARITFDGGAVISYRGSWVSPGPPTPWAGEWRIECEHGEIRWTSRADQGTSADRVTVRSLDKRPQRLELPELPYIDRAASLRAFVDAIQQKHEPLNSGRDNLGSLALVHAAVASAASGVPQGVTV